ncbi:TPM domain-containing protein [Synechococcus sp. RSCCF101]|uniref:photosystem II repair protein Psb32 n=1 Tax=Synechococcus sp. RSCCF101 TaxID=2511069 RepID=UPI001246DC5B|nr:TPM domain-containing protein [Synechococcus sp. RSCCF101]QEY31749.1 TPM domain-containing protein [Synechococcus sp. RSCCF101]
MARTFWHPLLTIGACLLMLLAAPGAGRALSAADLPASLPQERVLDSSGVLSRAVTSELERTLGELSDGARVDARLVTVPRLDYGLSPKGLANDLIDRWQPDEPGPGGLGQPGLLLLLIDSQNKSAAVAVSDDLAGQLPASLLRSTARDTMAPALRDGARYRQASVEAIERLGAVLGGGEDPGPPEVVEQTLVKTNVPTREETQESNAFTWVVVLLVVGTIVPMATWWVFSR